MNACFEKHERSHLIAAILMIFEDFELIVSSVEKDVANLSVGD
tara:strand:+ start:456 stop:584 length:129 start_codon:yes stop_codon:yes gene_type:complete